jgi:hypothetical protein
MARPRNAPETVSSISLLPGHIMEEKLEAKCNGQA